MLHEKRQYTASIFFTNDAMETLIRVRAMYWYAVNSNLSTDCRIQSLVYEAHAICVILRTELFFC